MMNSRLRLIVILFCLGTLSVSFTNCSAPVAESSADVNVAGGAQYNGGGHSGKLIFLSTQLEDLCSLPTLRLEFVNGQGRAFADGRKGTQESAFDASRLLASAFDPGFLIYKDQIFAQTRFLKLALNERAHFEKYCVNSSYRNSAGSIDGISFALKISKFNTSAGIETVTTGYLTSGKVDADPSIISGVGRLLDTNSNGQVVFTANSGQYHITFESPFSSTRTRGEIRMLKSGERVPVDCFLKEISPKTDGL